MMTEDCHDCDDCLNGLLLRFCRHCTCVGNICNRFCNHSMPSGLIKLQMPFNFSIFDLSTFTCFSFLVLVTLSLSMFYFLRVMSFITFFLYEEQILGSCIALSIPVLRELKESVRVKGYYLFLHNHLYILRTTSHFWFIHFDPRLLLIDFEVNSYVCS